MSAELEEEDRSSPKYKRLDDTTKEIFRQKLLSMTEELREACKS